MSDPRYIEVGTPETKVIEKCSELIQSICKAQRFGWFAVHPHRPGQSNIDDVKAEMDDVVEAFERLEIHLRELKKAYHEGLKRQAWHKEYQARLIEKGFLTVADAEAHLKAALPEINYNDDPVDAADTDMSYWSD